MSQQLYEVLNAKGKSIMTVHEDTAKRTSEKIGGSYRPFNPPVREPEQLVQVGNFLAPERLVDDVFGPTTSGRFEVVPNGFGGNTTRRRETTTPNTDRAPGRPMSEKAQAALKNKLTFVRTLLEERKGIEAAEEIRADMNQVRERGIPFTFEAVDEAITRLLLIPKPRTNRAPANLPDVPQGHYAIASKGDNDLAFYRVDRPTEGQYAGRTFVKLVVGGRPDSNVAYRNVPGILARIIESGIADSAHLYGQAIGRCCRCNRHLTDESSRAAGIGPECATKE